LLLVVIVNFAGVMIASGLGLFNNGQWASGFDPIVGWAVVFGSSVICYSACLWGIQAAVGKRRSGSGESKAADLSNKEGHGDEVMDDEVLHRLQVGLLPFQAS
jgi:hypothetical protein